MTRSFSSGCSGGIGTEKLDWDVKGRVEGGSKVVLLACGSFNPPHKVHLRMLELAKDALDKSGVPVLGAYMSPVSSHYKKKGLVDAEHRVAMCQLAAAQSPVVMVDDWEATQPQWSRTHDVLDSVRERVGRALAEKKGGAGDVRVMIVCGSDLIESFKVPNLWSDEHLESLVIDHGIVCISRSGYDGKATLDSIPALHERKEEWQMVFVENDFLTDLSSTKLRAALDSDESIADLVPEGVYGYILEHSLYK
ncbi:nicotinamide/nicotinic acid mononucleotide adenylyltransferase [Chloropicon primus]|uniref:Nicotinamide-nucleotide adenylyltransferase n=1 Tax=Chloropicon primus TaxID=1764295 RepID=A0A5B8MTB9_9CHLO|nr:nicotinamide-nucleotide adenylyltransferase [Chloropicon primus]UPR03230.1 nicotinamide/nicotinic acid mononucleotide adenylyltransferase [Chloropicon primus]|eukprot:QDZ24018.1 nicotinamide-nucleotide adenylyltransferase [Chloropicon primus]